MRRASCIENIKVHVGEMQIEGIQCRGVQRLNPTMRIRGFSYHTAF